MLASEAGRQHVHLQDDVLRPVLLEEQSHNFTMPVNSCEVQSRLPRVIHASVIHFLFQKPLGVRETGKNDGTGKNIHTGIIRPPALIMMAPTAHAALSCSPTHPALTSTSCVLQRAGHWKMGSHGGKGISPVAGAI